MAKMLQSINLDNMNEISEFCVNEIALEGLEGCKLVDLFKLLYKSSCLCINILNETSDSASTRIHNLFSFIHNSNDMKYKNFIWKLIVSQPEVNFYARGEPSSQSTSKSTPKAANTKSKKQSNETSKIINDNENRGYSFDYFKRNCVDRVIRQENEIKSYQDCLNEYGTNLILVANQQTRNKVLCPPYKFLDFEFINDLEYCILEKIARSRYDGVYTTSTGTEEGLAKTFNLTSKQLHYTLVQLEIHGLIRKQVLKSEKKRSIIYLIKYAFRNKSYLENVCEYLSTKTSDLDEQNYSDSFVNLKNKFHFTNKQFKTLVHNGEKQNFFKRFIVHYKVKVKKNSKILIKSRQMRMLKLTENYFKSLSQDEEANETSSLIDNDDENLDEDDDDTKSSQFIECIGSEQANTLPLYTQILDRIEASGKEGISLKKLGHIFGFDFYKARRLGSNLQTNSEIVTIMKETSHGKAKYQNLVLRKFLKLNTPNTAISEPASTVTTIDEAESNENSTEATSEQQKSDEPELVLIKRDNQPSKTIQALMSDRSIARKRIILNYLEKHRICTKYEINKEIRRIESEQQLKGCIDSKTTKRMLIAMEKEKKLHIFTVNLKNVSYMGVRSYDVSEKDPLFENYCATFKRTFDTVDLKFKTEKVDLDLDEHVCQTSEKEALELEETDQKREEKSFQLKRTYISSIMSKLKFSSSYSKAYGLVPKFQKAIVLHRFLHYLLFFYDGVRQDQVEPLECSFELSSQADKEVVDSVALPGLDRTYKRVEPQKPVHWSTYVPPIQRSTAKTTKTSSSEDNCLFIGEILSHMPVSVFCSIIVINYQVPGLVALLKHPQKRHVLVKDLPPSLIAPLIFERRYLRRILNNLQILACLGLITFVESPCNTNQAVNRDVQSQLVHVHRKAAFYDTSVNNANDWDELRLINEYNMNLTLNDTDKDIFKYDKLFFEFTTEEDVIDYWRKLLHVSMNTYKFSVSRYLHESKRLRQELLCKILPKLKVSHINELWQIEMFGDHMGPGGYSSQLFLNSFKNWMLQSNVISGANTNNYSSKRANKRSSRTTDLAITKEDDLSTAANSELALVFPFGVFRGLAASSQRDDAAQARKTSAKRKLTESSDDDAQKRRKIVSTFISRKPRKITSEKTLKQIKAKYLIDKAKVYKFNSNIPSQQISSSAGNESKKITSDRRAIWQPDEDELILLIKVASLYFLPEEKTVPFKLIADAMNELIPQKCADKKVSSFGRRIKILLKSNMNLLFVSNKLELCKQDAELATKYKEARTKVKRNLVDKPQVDLYAQFVRDIREKLLKMKQYKPDCIENQEKKYQLPATMKEFKERFIVKNTSKDILSTGQSAYFQQPTTDYEITSNTLHSAIHSSILINDRNPRISESFNLFDKYSDQLLTDVIYKMSRVHKIIAPTKCSELKKKNVTAFSKHIGKAYHISQRYQYKWTNNISAAILTETNKFKNELKEFNLSKSRQADEMFDCTDKDDVGMTSFLAHTIENSQLQVQIDVPNRIWVSKLI